MSAVYPWFWHLMNFVVMPNTAGMLCSDIKEHCEGVLDFPREAGLLRNIKITVKLYLVYSCALSYFLKTFGVNLLEFASCVLYTLANFLPSQSLGLFYKDNEVLLLCPVNTSDIFIFIFIFNLIFIYLIVVFKFYIYSKILYTWYIFYVLFSFL